MRALASPLFAALFTLPPAGGLGALTITVDAPARALHLTAGAAQADVPIELGADEMPEASAIVVEPIAIGDGKRVAHVRVPSKRRADVAWEAIVAGRDGASAVIWSGVTGYAGDGTGVAIDVEPRDAQTRFVLVGDLREDLRICGQARTLLAPRALDPKTLELRGATMQRLPQAQREEAERVIASPRGGPAEPPLARLLVASGASTAIGAPSALTDGDAATTWSEARAGDGHGEFVTMRAPGSVPLARIALTIAPPGPTASPSTAAATHGAAPRTLFLVTDTRTIAVTLPEDAWLHPGAAYEVPLVDPLRASCVSLVLDKAYAHADAPPDVTLAEVTAYSAFDAPGATLDQVAAALAGGGARADAAKAVLERAGDAGVAAAAKAYASLDAPGRALAIDSAIGAGTCESSGPLLLAAMGDPDREVARKGREKLERCGKRATPALVAAVRGKDAKAKASAAWLLAAVAPQQALDPLVDALAQTPQDDVKTRAAVRAAIAKASRAATKEKIAALVDDPARPADARLDLLRALEEQLPAIAAHADAALGALGAGAPSMRTRFLLVGPTAAIARAGDASATSRLTAMIASDPDPAVRAQAAESAVGAAGAREALARAIDADESPRVRESALRALVGAAKQAPPIASITKRLASDEWTFVRAAAAAALASFAPEPSVDQALASALADRAATVREAAIAALAAHGATRASKEIRARLADEHESLEVRLAAAKGLALLCDRDAIDPLTALARRAALPLASEEEIQLGLAAASALGMLHPRDLGDRLAPLVASDARAEAKAAARRALATPATCR